MSILIQNTLIFNTNMHLNRIFTDLLGCVTRHKYINDNAKANVKEQWPKTVKGMCFRNILLAISDMTYIIISNSSAKTVAQ